MAKIVCLGDSLTAGYPYDKELSWVQLCSKELLDINLINAGISNHTTGDMLARFDKDVTPHNPNAVFIMGGTNDAWQEVHLLDTQNNIKEMINKTININALPILGMLPPIIKEKVQMENVEQFNKQLKIIRNWLKEYSQEQGIRILDFYTPLCKVDSDQGDPHLFVDGGHPNRKGYQTLADNVKEDLRNIIQIL
ncbi:MAG: hypothetical protein FH758_10590 [Firmicutes bacterium]|nr:hypothetical protein [Bacillota bacterium]